MSAYEIVRALRDCAQDLLDVKGGTRKSAFVMVEASSLIENLQKQLAEAQRRADAAVEDLENLIDRECACSYCSHLLETGACALDIKYGDGTCSAQWRGVQDEKGEAE